MMKATDLRDRRHDGAVSAAQAGRWTADPRHGLSDNFVESVEDPSEFFFRGAGDSSANSID